MRPSPILLLTSLLVSPAVAGCGTPRTQQRDSAALAVAAGAVLMGAGALLTQEEGNDCADSDGFCLNLDEENEVLGGLLVLIGGGIAVTGLFRLAAAPPPAATQPAPPAANPGS